MTGHDMPEDEPNADPPPDDPWAIPPPPPVGWGPPADAPPAALPPWAAPPPYAHDPTPPSADDGRMDPAAPDRTHEAPADPWRIPPQPPWDPAHEPPPSAVTATDAPQPGFYRPSGPNAGFPPVSEATAFDLPPSATSPRSTPRPPASRPSGEPGYNPPGGPPGVYDEPWRREAAQRNARPGLRLRPRPVLIGVAGVAVAGLIAAGVVVLTQRGPSHDTSTGPAARLAGATFALNPAAKTDGRDQELLGVAASGSTVVAVGGELDTTDYRSEFLVSTDGGRSFHLATVRTPAGDEAPYGDAPQHIAGGNGSWVALGVSPGGGVVWTSRDGRSWTRHPNSAGVPFSGANRIAQVTRTASGFVAVGTTSAKGDFSDLAPVVWRSTDGARWTRLTADQLKISAKGERATLDAVAANGDTVVAHGWTASGTKRSDITEGFWRSTDGGVTWGTISTPHPDDSRLTVGAAFLAYGPGGFLIARDAKKKGAKPYGVLMSSADGRQWAPAGGIHVSGYGKLQHLVGSDQGWAAVLTAGSAMAITRSTDGRTWTNAGTVPMPGGRTVTDAAATSGVTLVVGRDGTGDGNNALLAARDLNGQEVPVDPSRVPGAVQADQAVSAITSAGGRLVAAGSTNGDAAVWTSADGKL
ncbi:MAG TPA: hypothetical protein VGD53_02595, partial [Actinoallomurus sp.]